MLLQMYMCLCVRVYLPFAIIICKQGAYRLSSLPQWTSFMSVECLKINFFSNIIIIFALLHMYMCTVALLEEKLEMLFLLGRTYIHI